MAHFFLLFLLTLEYTVPMSQAAVVLGCCARLATEFVKATSCLRDLNRVADKLAKQAQNYNCWLDDHRSPFILEHLVSDLTIIE
jgi:hypothetical protein